jgi:hypothetical protein
MGGEKPWGKVILLSGELCITGRCGNSKTWARVSCQPLPFPPSTTRPACALVYSAVDQCSLVPTRFCTLVAPYTPAPDARGACPGPNAKPDWARSSATTGMRMRKASRLTVFCTDKP